jgi:nucleoporin SEH1
LRVYECLEAPALTNWTLAEEADLPALPSTSASASHPHTFAAPTPTQISGPPAADALLVANALQQQQQQPLMQRGAGGREADGGWSVSWCKERYWGEVLATCSGISGVVKVSLSLPIPLSFPSRMTQRGTVDYTIVSIASPNHSSLA